MFTPGNIRVETVTRRKASAFVDNATAIVGLVVLGVPFTMSTIRCWALIAAANIQLVLGRLMPQMRLLGARRRGAHNSTTVKATRIEQGA
jgi:hypothetical protein